MQKNSVLKMDLHLHCKQKYDQCQNDDVDNKILLVWKETKENAFFWTLKKKMQHVLWNVDDLCRQSKKQCTWILTCEI